MIRFALPLSGAVLCVSLLAAMAEPQVVVRQADRQFDRHDIVLARGSVVRFTNEDAFLHQIYVDAPSFWFDSDEQIPGEDLDVAFTERGAFEVRCGIHPRMLLRVVVE